MSTNDSELRDESLWPADRLERAQVEIAEEQARRAAAEAADKAAALSAEEREQQSMKAFGALQGVEGRRQVLEKYGFDPGWSS